MFWVKMGTPHGGYLDRGYLKGERMSDLLNPANLIVLAVIVVGMFFWPAAHLSLRHTERAAAAMARAVRRPRR